MFKILYIGNKENIDIEKISFQITHLSGYDIKFIRENEIDNGMGHFFDTEPIMLLLIEENVDQSDNFITSIKEDESFLYLPIILVLNDNNQEKRKKYYSMGINNFISSGFDSDELSLTCNSALRNKIKLDEVVKQLSEVSEKNITKALQLDLLRKFIPLTVWEKTEFLAEGQDLEIPEEEQELAILFGDLQSFTTISELMTPKEVVQMLNGIFHIVTQIIYQNFGDIDKFIGDAFLSVFRHPEMALLSALTIQSALKFYNDLRIKDGQPVVNFRMGINYGKVIRGSVGGTSRYDNTLIGDPINTAQRLESMSPPGGVLVSKALLSKVSCLDVEKLEFKNYILKGKDKQVEACLMYDYYVKNPQIIDDLMELRKNIERNNN